MEGAATAITLVLVSGLFYPGVAVAMGLLYIVGRVFYALGYRSQGPKGRLIGAMMFDLALVVLMFYTITSLWNAGNGLEGFIDLMRSTAGSYGLQI